MPRSQAPAKQRKKFSPKNIKNAKSMYVLKMPKQKQDINPYTQLYTDNTQQLLQINWARGLRSPSATRVGRYSRNIPSCYNKFTESTLRDNRRIKKTHHNFNKYYQMIPNISKSYHLINNRIGGVANRSQLNFECGLRMRSKPKGIYEEQEKTWRRYQYKNRKRFSQMPIKWKNELTLRKTNQPMQTQSSFMGRQYPVQPRYNDKIGNIVDTHHLSSSGGRLPMINFTMSLRGGGRIKKLALIKKDYLQRQKSNTQRAR